MGKRGPLSAASRVSAGRMAHSSSEPERPKGLSKVARAEWARITGLLRERGILDALDQTALGDYITCWERLRECEADINARGVLVDGDRGKVKNPAVQIARTYRNALMLWCKEYGLTYGSRIRSEMPAPTNKQSKWAALRDYAPSRYPHGIEIEAALCGLDEEPKQ